MLSNVDYKAIGRRIEARRKELGLTLVELAMEVDLSASTIQRYEKGRFDKIKMPVIEAIASALHVNPDWLIGNTDDPVDYEDGDLLASVPLSYIELFDGDVEKAYQCMQAVDNENLGAVSSAPMTKGRRDFARDEHEEEMLLLARHIAPIPDEQRKKLIEALKTSADFYLDAMGIGREDT